MENRWRLRAASAVQNSWNAGRSCNGKAQLEIDLPRRHAAHSLPRYSPWAQKAPRGPGPDIASPLHPTPTSLVLRHGALLPEGTHGRDVGLVPLLLGVVGPRRQLDERVQRDLHPGALLLRHVHVVGVDAAQHGLVGDDEDVLAALELHDDGLQPDDHVAVGLAPAVAVVVLVLVARREVLRVEGRDLLVREPVAHARVELVERLPLQLRVHARAGGEEARRLDGAFEGRGPDGEFAVVAHGLVDQGREGPRVELAARGDVRVASDLALEIELGFSVLPLR